MSSDGDTPDSALGRAGRSGDKPPTAQSCAPPEHPQVLGEVLSLRAGDIENLSLVSNMKEEELVNWLITNSYAITR